MKSDEHQNILKIKRTARNKTITLSKQEINEYGKKLLKVSNLVSAKEIENKIINSDLFEAEKHLPDSFVNLLFIDPPYNLTKNFNSRKFSEMSVEDYEKWLVNWLGKINRMLKPNSSIYICGDWKSSSAIFNVARRYFIPQNRITWEREKGRGAKANWKNCSEDIWFFTKSKEFIFNLDDVKIKRKVIAPYRDEKGTPKDWEKHEHGNFRMTHPSNVWTDITIPFWSMAENTDHPTQKPEKLLAKIILASSNEGDLVFDPFLGSGTTAVVAKKLGRKYCGVEIDEYYCCLAEKRLADTKKDISIQGYSDGVFWERNTLQEQVRLYSKNNSAKKDQNLAEADLFSG
ncbi:MAG: DNA methylase [Ignavibacteria bacterium RIFOXYA2_FULL_35_9]|nr:MAG: DNA methylase [Ignavibacteria bacterium RIFOXYA2_FULL_35_9]